MKFGELFTSSFRCLFGILFSFLFGISFIFLFCCVSKGHDDVVVVAGEAADAETMTPISHSFLRGTAIIMPSLIKECCGFSTVILKEPWPCYPGVCRVIASQNFDRPGHIRSCGFSSSSHSPGDFVLMCFIECP